MEYHKQNLTGGHGGCEPKIEVIVKMQKKSRDGSGRGMMGVGGWVGGCGWTHARTRKAKPICSPLFQSRVITKAMGKIL